VSGLYHRYYKLVDGEVRNEKKIKSALLSVKDSLNISYSNNHQTRRHNLCLLILVSTLLTLLLRSCPRQMACHDLCTLRKPPPKLRHLLGLGLNYCLQPSKPTKLDVLEDSLTCFQRDIYVKFFFRDRPSDWNLKQLYLKTDWEPNPDDLPPEFRA
jgi:hypothetical protein